MKHIVNLNTAKQDLYVDGELIVSGANIVGASGITTVKVQARADVSDVCSSVAIDNFTLGTPISGNSPKSVGYMTEDGIIEAENGVIPLASDALRIALDDAKEGNVSVKIYANNTEIESVSAYVDSQSNLDILLSNPLPECSNIKIVANFGAYSLLAKCRTGVYGFGITDVAFETDGENCYIAKQITPESELSLNFKIANNTSDSQTGLVLFAVYNGTHLVKLVPYKAILGVGEDDSTVLTVTIPESDGEYSAECYMIDDFAGRNMLSGIYSVN